MGLPGISDFFGNFGFFLEFRIFSGISDFAGNFNCGDFAGNLKLPGIAGGARDAGSRGVWVLRARGPYGSQGVSQERGV